METVNLNQDNKRTLKNDPQYFGSYLNLARHNIFTINNHIAKKFDFQQLNDEAEISNSMLVNASSKSFISRQSHIYAVAKRFLSIIKVFDFESLPEEEREGKENTGKNFKRMSESLKVVFSEINQFRNDYTHYFSLKTGTDRKTKVSDALKSFLNENFQLAVQYTQQRFKDVFVQEDFAIVSKSVLVKEDNTITQDGLVFLTSMFLDRENAFHFISKIVGLKGTQEKAFLAKREVMMAYCITSPNEKFVSENTAQAFSLEIINELNKCPKTLFNVIIDDAKKEFQPDVKNIENVLNNSVPDSIEDYESYIESITKRIRHQDRFTYFALKYIDEKKLFEKIRFQIDLGKIILDEYSKTLNGEEETRRVVENAKAFGRLQDLQDEEKIVASINKTKSDLQFEQFAPHYNLDNNKIGVSFKDETPIYISSSSNEAGKAKTNLKQPVVEAFLSVHDLHKVILLEHFEPGKAEKLIKEFVEINNSKLFNWDFIEEIRQKLSDFDDFKKRSQGRKQMFAYNTETLSRLRSRKQKLNEILEEHNLNDKQIPTRILDYWLNIKDVEAKTSVSDRIKLMKEDCKQRIKQLSRGNAPKIGEMATFVAKDIVQMIIDVNKKKKITSFYYDKMQECLALYDIPEKKKLLIHILKDELKLYEKGGHPFLAKIDFANIKYAREVYKIYLEEKGKKMVKELNHKSGKMVEKDKSWLQTVFYRLEWSEKANKNLTVVKLPEDKTKIPYTLLQLEKEKNDFKTWFNNVTKGKKHSENGKEYQDRKKPIDLPTNLFDETLKTLFIRELKENSIEAEAYKNYNEPFKTWWKEVRKDETQPFYNAERNYVFEVNDREETLDFKINTQPKFSDYYSGFANKLFKLTNEEREMRRKKEQKTKTQLPDISEPDVIKSVRNRVAETEKQVRIIQEQDRIMLLMFEGLVGTSLDSKLRNIKELHDETIEVKENVTGNLMFDPSGNIVEKEKRQPISKYIVEDRKRKEFSVLKKYSFDKRLPELFEYFSADSIPMPDLKLEIETYTKVKDKVFDAIFEMERAIVEKDKDDVLAYIETEASHIQHKPYLFWLQDKGIITSQEFVFMNMVRNTFSHNQYPQKSTMELFVKSWNKSKFAEQILEIYNQKKELIISKINNI